MTPEHQEAIENARIKTCAIGLQLITEHNDKDMSRAGTNTVYHHCDIYQGRPSYASCLMVMDQVFERGVHELRPECAKAIDDRACPAMGMRMMELEANRALFYIDYQELSRRRHEQWAKDAEDGIKFRKRGDGTATKKFVPTRFDEKGQPIWDKAKLAELEPIVPKKPQVASAPTDDDFNLNIMEQVVKKVLNG